MEHTLHEKIIMLYLLSSFKEGIDDRWQTLHQRQ